MGQARTNARRRRQAKNNFNHLAPQDRPNYKKRDAATAARHNARVLERERTRAQRKGMSKK